MPRRKKTILEGRLACRRLTSTYVLHHHGFTNNNILYYNILCNVFELSCAGKHALGVQNGEIDEDVGNSKMVEITDEDEKCKRCAADE